MIFTTFKKNKSTSDDKMTEANKNTESGNVSSFSWIIVFIIILFTPVFFNSTNYFELKTLIQISFIMIFILAIINVLFIGKYYQLKFELTQIKEKYKK